MILYTQLSDPVSMLCWVTHSPCCSGVMQRLVRAVGVPGAQGEERAILVLSANSLQKWYLAPGQADRLVYECNVEKHIRESFVDHVWVSLMTSALFCCNVCLFVLICVLLEFVCVCVML